MRTMKKLKQVFAARRGADGARCIGRDGRRARPFPRGR